jgi:hypothetical protein
MDLLDKDNKTPCVVEGAIEVAQAPSLAALSLAALSLAASFRLVLASSPVSSVALTASVALALSVALAGSDPDPPSRATSLRISEQLALGKGRWPRISRKLLAPGCARVHGRQ